MISETWFLFYCLAALNGDLVTVNSNAAIGAPYALSLAYLAGLQNEGLAPRMSLLFKTRIRHIKLLFSAAQVRSYRTEQPQSEGKLINSPVYMKFPCIHSMYL
jgi:hypothetical protein